MNALLVQCGNGSHAFSVSDAASSGGQKCQCAAIYMRWERVEDDRVTADVRTVSGSSR